jgi:hypothetical protein
MNLRSDGPTNKRPATKLVVYDIQKGLISGFDGNVLSQQMSIKSSTPNEDLDWDGFKESIESIRISSVAGTIERNSLYYNNYRAKFGYAHDEVSSWGFTAP